LQELALSRRPRSCIRHDGSPHTLPRAEKGLFATSDSHRAELMVNMSNNLPRHSDDALPKSPAASGGISRLLWNAAGTFFLSLGIVGIVIPLLPTTPFLLLAAACYLRGSARMHRWILTNRYFGEYLRDYQAGRGMPWKNKIVTVSLLWAVIAFSAVFATSSTIIRIVLLVVAVGVTIHILTLKTKRKEPSHGRESWPGNEKES